MGVESMILFDNEAKARDQFFGTSAKDIVEFVKRYSVRLDAGAFVGSGVMVSCSSDSKYVYILTAKHNLTVRGKLDDLGEPAWTDTSAIAKLHQTFVDKVTIRADAFNVSGAGISNIFYFGREWLFDVFCLASDDAKLLGL